MASSSYCLIAKWHTMINLVNPINDQAFMLSCQSGPMGMVREISTKYTTFLGLYTNTTIEFREGKGQGRGLERGGAMICREKYFKKRVLLSNKSVRRHSAVST